ncbi:MAG TPA: hypothetical protein VK715_10245 [Steroidobacteraceae bacterium]|jgi:hypothetical protein|nr:hypothetical protein [Steroidobacteraceae bacterium]
MTWSKVPVFALLCMAGIGTALSSTLPLTLSGTIINQNPPPGTAVCTSTSSAQCAENYTFAAGSVSSGGYVPVVAGPTSYSVGDTFNQAQGAVVQTQSDFGASAYSNVGCVAGQPGNCVNSKPFLDWNFQDNYQFTTPSSGTEVSGALISFLSGTTGLSDLQARIIETSATAPHSLIGGNGGGVTVVDSWTNMTSGGGPLTLYSVALEKTPLAAGQNYILQVRGEAASSASYNGNVVFTPVPLPAALLLLASGLTSMGAFTRRRRATMLAV